MDLKIETTQLEDHLRVTAEGTFGREAMFRLIDVVRDEAARVGMRRVLLDCSRVRGSVSELECYTIGERAATVWGPGLRVAAIFPDQDAHDVGEDVAVNRGARLVIKHSEPEAMAWLMAGVPGGWD